MKNDLGHMKKSTKHLLFERVQHLNPSHRFPLNEEYQSLLNEEEDVVFGSLAKTFTEHKKLTGVLSEDRRYLKEFINLAEKVEDFDPFAHLKATKKIDEKEDCLLFISPPNEKLDHPNLSLPAGYTCPFAEMCKTLVPRDREKIHGKLVQDYGDIRCYAASEEARYPAAQEHRWTNKDLLDEFDQAGKVDLILRSIKYYEQQEGRIDVFRIHESGDFYDMEYFESWLGVAQQRPDILFYAYTKSLPFWVKHLGKIPVNMKLIASMGGKRDDLISKHDLKYTVVVNSPEEAKNLHLPIDIDDTLAYNYDGNFALLIHGTQPAGTTRSMFSVKNREILKKLKRGLFNF
jgi:hypothetical protein